MHFCAGISDLRAPDTRTKASSHPVVWSEVSRLVVGISDMASHPNVSCTVGTRLDCRESGSHRYVILQVKFSVSFSATEDTLSTDPQLVFEPARQTKRTTAV